MTVKELEKKLNELQAELESLKNKKDKLTFAGVKVGESFVYNDLEFTKLNEQGLSIINTYNDIDCCFDNYDNNYEKSLIRYFINNRYCELMKINKEDLEPVNSWGDKLTLLSKEEYEQYRSVIKNYDSWWWLRSPHSAYSYGAFNVNYSGDWNNLGVGYNSIAPRAVLILKSDTQVSLIQKEE